jgi:hypothetical protein
MQGHKSTDYKKFSISSNGRWCHPLDPTKCVFETQQISLNITITIKTIRVTSPYLLHPVFSSSAPELFTEDELIDVALLRRERKSESVKEKIRSTVSFGNWHRSA